MKKRKKNENQSDSDSDSDESMHIVEPKNHKCKSIDEYKKSSSKKKSHFADKTEEEKAFLKQIQKDSEESGEATDDEVVTSESSVE